MMEIFFFLDLREFYSRKAYFVGLDERVKPWLSKAFTRNIYPDSNSKSVMQISNFLSSTLRSLQNDRDAKVDDGNLSMVLSGQNEEPFSCSGGHIGMVVGFRVLKTIVSASIFL